MDPILGVLLTNAAAAGALAMAAWVASRRVRRPALIHALWLVAVLRLLAPPLLWVPILPGGATAHSRGPQDGPLTAANAARMAAGRALRAQAPVLNATPTAWPAAATTVARAPSWRETTGAPTHGRFATRLAWAVMLVGGAGVIALSVWRHSRFRLLLRPETPAPAGVVARAEVLARRLGLRRAPALRLVAAPLPPMLWPTLRGPQLLLPRDLLGQLSDEERDTLLVHELAHLRRRDHWVRLAEISATALFWWYPLAWWMRRALRRAEERCCDEWVLRTLPGSARAYASGLLKTASLVADLTPLPAGASGAGPVHELESRLKEILMTRPLPQAAAPLRLLLATLAVAGLTVFPTRAASTVRQDETPPASAAAAKAPAVAPALITPPSPGPYALTRPARVAATPPAGGVVGGVAGGVLAGVPLGVRGGIVGGVPGGLPGRSEDAALDSERRALQQQRRELHQKELELERQSIELEARAERQELTAEAARLRQDGKADEAARVEKSIELGARRVELQRRQLQLETERTRLEGELEAAEAAGGDDAALERSRQTLDEKQQALQAEVEKAEREMEALEAEQRVQELRGSSDQLRQSLAEQVQALREALPAAGSQKAELEREIQRVEAALDALRPATPRSTP